MVIWSLRILQARRRRLGVGVETQVTGEGRAGGVKGWAATQVRGRRRRREGMAGNAGSGGPGGDPG